MEMFSCFAMWNSYPKFVRNFQLHSAYACGLLRFRINLQSKSLSDILQDSVDMGSGHRKAPVHTEVSARKKNAEVHPCSRSVLNSVPMFERSKTERTLCRTFCTWYVIVFTQNSCEVPSSTNSRVCSWAGCIFYLTMFLKFALASSVGLWSHI
jgi:hypothetical protein